MRLVNENMKLSRIRKFSQSSLEDAAKISLWGDSAIYVNAEILKAFFGGPKLELGTCDIRTMILQHCSPPQRPRDYLCCDPQEIANRNSLGSRPRIANLGVNS